MESKLCSVLVCSTSKFTYWQWRNNMVDGDIVSNFSTLKLGMNAFPFQNRWHDFGEGTWINNSLYGYGSKEVTAWIHNHHCISRWKKEASIIITVKSLLVSHFLLLQLGCSMADSELGNCLKAQLAQKGNRKRQGEKEIGLYHFEWCRAKMRVTGLSWTKRSVL